jgi:hypothetical protein
MKVSLLKKVLTLLSSITLVTLFLLYRVGYFDNASLLNQSEFQSSHNGGTVTSTPNNPLKPKKDTSKQLMLSSSKVLILTDKKPIFLDSLKNKSNKTKYPKNETEILSSSKSAIIFKPQPQKKVNIDSLIFKSDTLKNKKKKE